MADFAKSLSTASILDVASSSRFFNILSAGIKAAEASVSVMIDMIGVDSPLALKMLIEMRVNPRPFVP